MFLRDDSSVAGEWRALYDGPLRRGCWAAKHNRWSIDAFRTIRFSRFIGNDRRRTLLPHQQLRLYSELWRALPEEKNHFDRVYGISRQPSGEQPVCQTAADALGRARAHLLLQVLFQVLNGDWRFTLSQWYPGMQATPELEPHSRRFFLASR